MLGLAGRHLPAVRRRRADLFIAPADLLLADGQVAQPDLFVTTREREGRAPQRWEEVTTVPLAVEVLSPSTARLDRTVKRRLNQARGVQEYWIVDLDARLVERWRPADERGEVVTEQLDWRPEGASDALAIDLAEYFAQVRGERR